MESFEERADNVMYAVFGGKHHWPNKIKKSLTTPAYYEMNTRGSFSTFDNERLTRLVLACHEQCIRAEIGPSGPGMIKIKLHRRKNRDGKWSERHPGIREAIERYEDER